VVHGVLEGRVISPPQCASGESVSPLRSENWRISWAIEYRKCREDMSLMLCPVLGSLEAKGGSWDAEMWGNFAQSRPWGDECATNGVNSQGISGQQSVRNPRRTCH